MSLPRGVPVYVTYLTMVPSASGMAKFEDRYGWDRPGVLAGGMDMTVGISAAAGTAEVIEGSSGAKVVKASSPQ
jgi:hypothetical protein